MKTFLGLVLMLFLATFPCVSSAKSVRETTYRYDQIWSTVVRFLRVDSGFSVMEQDKGTGYVLFEYVDAGRSLNGSMELIPQVRNGAEAVVMGIRIQGMPTYVENVLMDKLVRKLRDEYGEPPVGKRVQDAPSQINTEEKAAQSISEEDSDEENAKDTIENDEHE